MQDRIIETRTHTLTQLKENGGERDNLAKRQSKSRSEDGWQQRPFRVSFFGW